GNMIVGTCATKAAPTTSPIGPSSPAGRRRRHDVLDVCVEVEAPPAALTADPGVARPAERRVEIAYEEAVDPDGAGDELFADALSLRFVAGVNRGGKAVVGAVGELDGLGLVAERLDRQHWAEDLAGQQRGTGWHVHEHSRPVVEAAEVFVRAAAC